MKCPKCNTENTQDSQFCKKCATSLAQGEAQPSITKTTETPREVLTTGSTFAGRYQIIKELGRGGMGVVYKAEDTKLKRSVALKFLPPELTHIPEVKDRFMREAQAAAVLDHPHICTVYEFDEAEEKTFISMAYIEGQSLKKKTESGPLELDEALRIAIQVADGLQEAHKKGVVHRDIKGANIMVTEKGQAKILDFGLASMTGGTLLTKEGMAMGTIAYMSPEQALGGQVDDRTDVWSLGVVLYELLTGLLPFKADHEQAVVYHILNKPAISVALENPSVSSELDGLVMKMLEKDPSLRPSAKEVTEILSKNTGVPIDFGEDSSFPDKIPTMVGRAAQEALMSDVFNIAVQGHARLLCVTGEPGIGKTTLTENFLRTLRSERQPCLVASGRCSERLAGTEAYLPLLEALESMMRNGLAGRIAPIMKRLAPTWFFRIDPPQSGDTSDSRLWDDARTASQERMKRELFAFLRELSRSAPIVLFFDDVHWADISTIDLLSYLGAHGDNLKLLTIVTYRPTELLLSEHPFIGVKRELQGRGICEEIGLGFLGQEDIVRYLNLEFPNHSFAQDLIDFVHARTEGNPLFLANMLRYLQSLGAIIDQGGWHLARPLSDIEEEVPESIRSMIERKVDQLAESDRQLLTAASVQGAEFHAAVVAEAMGVDEADVEESLEKLHRVHAFVHKVAEEEMPDGSLTLRYQFVHALYQNTLYESLTPARRAKMSAVVATALANRYEENVATVSGELGMLYEAARQFAEASDSFIQAAIKATRVYANHEAVELYFRAITCAKKLKGLERDQRLLMAEMGTAHGYMTMGRMEDAAESYKRAERAAEAAGMTEERLTAICGRGMSLFQSKGIEEMGSVGEQAMELARSVNSAVGMASAELVLASQRLCLGELEEAMPLYEHAIPVHQRAGLPEHGLVGVALGGALHAWRQEYEEGHRILNISIDKARELGTGFGLLTGLFFKGMVLGNEGRLGEAFKSLNDAIRLAELNQDYYFLPRLPNTIGWLYRELEDFEKSHHLNLENVELAREHGIGEGGANANINLAIDCLSLGEPERAYAHLQEAQRIFAEDIWFRWRYNIRLQAVFAQYWIVRGNLDAARKHAEASEEAARSHQSKKHQAWALKILAEISLLEDDVSSAQKCLDKAIGILTAKPCPTIAWKIYKDRAQIAKKLRDEAVADGFRRRARATVRSLADSLMDDKIRTKFLKSRSVELL